MSERKITDSLKTSFVKSIGRFIARSDSPDELLGDLFNEVQKQRVFADGKTFVDLVPRRRAKEIVKEYRLMRNDPDFNLAHFVERHFYEFAPYKDNQYIMSPNRSPRQHVSELWDQLTRRNRKNRGSLLALPYKYVVPGGRFSEQFYWDTYFIMLGLAADNKWGLINGMIKNYAYMISQYGFIPTANRTYFLSRSQPPFFAKMLQLLAKNQGESVLVEYLPYMISEYNFWMKGQSKLTKINNKVGRVVMMPDGEILNRYFDNKNTPRPESQLEDIETAGESNGESLDKVYLDLRAGAESGWDFSSRWFSDPQNIHTIETTDIVPIDLNCLLYDLELEIAKAYKIIKQTKLARRYEKAAEKRKQAMQKYFWDDQTEFFYDYNLRKNGLNNSKTLAACFMLYSRVATAEQAELVAETLNKEFLFEGGLTTTLVENGQQWDAPNGWAPLNWVAIQGLRNYHLLELADKIKYAWMNSIEFVFSTEHKMVEKYAVYGDSRLGGGGEYALQDGFGWTNGVYAALHDNFYED